MPIKLSDSITLVSPKMLEPHPWNFARPPRDQIEKEEFLAFKQSIWKDGIWTDKPIVITKEKPNGKYQILRGRRRWEAIVDGIQKGKVDDKYKIPCLFLESDFEEVGLEVIYGDNDSGKKYRPEERQKIIIERWGLKNILVDYRGGDYTSSEQKARYKEPLRDIIKKAIPQWTIHQIERDLSAIKAAHKNSKYPEVDEEMAEKLNRQVLAWWERVKQKQAIEKEMAKVLDKFGERIQKANNEISTFSKGFPAPGGPEKYLEQFIDSKRPEFKPLKKISGLVDYIKKKGGE